MSESLRDQLAAVADKVLSASTDAATPDTQAPVEAPAATESAQTAEERARDEKGRFTESKEPDKSVPVAPKAVPVQGAQTQATPQGPKYPSTWKKGLEPHFEKLPPEVIAEIQRREGDYAKGVSTYKQEWDRAKPLLEAIAPYEAELRQYGIAPEQHVARLFGAHKMLALGAPEQKLSMFVRLAQDYQVPLERLFTRGEDGQVYLNTQLAQQTPQQPAMTEAQIAALVEKQLVAKSTESEISSMAADTQTYPHFAEVRETMAGILQAGLATDLKGAYAAAMRLPQHSEIFEAEQNALRQAEEKRLAEERQKATNVARRAAVSPRSTTPTSAATTTTAKGLRATIENAFDSHAGGRV